MARIYHPLTAKIVLNCLPPIGFSGGRLVDMPKPGANHSIPLGYRDLTVTNSDSKPLLSFLRQKAAPHMNSSAHSGQYGGGCNNGSTATAHLHARAYLDVAVAQSMSLIAFL